MTRSCREAEVDDVAVLDDVFLAFEPDFTVVAAPPDRAAGDQRFVGHDLGPDEATRDVAVNLTRRQLRRCSARDRPGAALVFADREERNIPEQIVAGPDHAI